MTLPLLLSLPHAGLEVPESLQGNCLLSPQQIIADSDEFAREIYGPLETQVAVFVRTEIARAVLDMNRAEDDFRKDGVVKTHTCWEVPIWREPLSESTVHRLLDTYYKPYHRQLSAGAGRSGVLLGVDCHTMAAHGPPVGPDPGAERPQVCLGNAGGKSCPEEWIQILQSALQSRFPGRVALNSPFSGGYITCRHGLEMPWVQLEISRGEFAGPMEKGSWVKTALAEAVGAIAQYKNV